MSKKVLVLGSSGAMGQYLVPLLSEMGYSVTAVSLDDERPCSERVRCIKADAKDRATVEALLAEGYDGVVDFMVYWSDDFKDVYKLFLDNTAHYIYFSTYRIYADEEHPIKETSPRLLEATTDEALRASNDYCIYKAKGEDLLLSSEYKNWTAVRPAITYSRMRYQLVTLEAPNTVARAKAGKAVVLPIEAKDKQATMSWAGDVAKMLARLLFNPVAYREIYSVTTSEHHTWGEIAEYYRELCGLRAVWVPKEDYISILGGDDEQRTLLYRRQLEYDRLFDRIMDNSKILAATGMKAEELMPLYDGLKYEIARFDENTELPVNERMDKYLEERGL
jgi:nucleoside-diphosphate-sugar epimerase